MVLSAAVTGIISYFLQLLGHMGFFCCSTVNGHWENPVGQTDSSLAAILHRHPPLSIHSFIRANVAKKSAEDASTDQDREGFELPTHWTTSC